MLIANRLSLADRAPQPGAYGATVPDDILSWGKYLIKPVDASKGTTPIMNTNATHVHKKARFNVEDTSYIRKKCPITICQLRRNHAYKFVLRDNDRVLLYKDVQVCQWLSISRPNSLFLSTEESCVSQILHHYKVNQSSDNVVDASSLYHTIHEFTGQDEFTAIAYFIPEIEYIQYKDVYQYLIDHIEMILELITKFTPAVMIVVIPMTNQYSENPATELFKFISTTNYTVT